LHQDIGRELWLDARTKGIGGTDAAAILGLSRWSTPLQVWLEKRGEAAPQSDREPEWLWWGRQVEPLIALRFSQSATGREVWKPDGIRQHPEIPCFLGSFDYLLMNERAGLDCKTARRGDEWGEPGTDEIPASYVVQCQHYMAITGFRRWYVAVLIGGSEQREYEVHTDGELQDFMRAKLLEWWNRHVVAGERPEMDGHERTRQWLAHRFPQETAPLLRAPLEANPLAQELWRARCTLEEIEELKRSRENSLKELIGEHAGIEGEGWRATWKKTKGREKVNFDLLAEELYQRLSRGIYEHKLPLALESREELRARFSEYVDGSRRFLFKWAGEES
jgi:putative phage-type endonuclease